MSRVTEFDITSAIKGMNDNSVKVTMLSMTSEFARFERSKSGKRENPGGDDQLRHSHRQ